MFRIDNIGITWAFSKDLTLWLEHDHKILIKNPGQTDKPTIALFSVLNSVFDLESTYNNYYMKMSDQPTSAYRFAICESGDVCLLFSKFQVLIPTVLLASPGQSVRPLIRLSSHSHLRTVHLPTEPTTNTTWQKSTGLTGGFYVLFFKKRGGQMGNHSQESSARTVADACSIVTRHCCRDDIRYTHTQIWKCPLCSTPPEFWFRIISPTYWQNRQHTKGTLI